MKLRKKILALLLSMMMILTLGVTALAQEAAPTVDADKGSGSITVQNAAKGETYNLYRLFDATVSAAQTEGQADSIVYTGTIPDSLSGYFTADQNGYITAADAAWKDPSTKAEMSDGLRDALKDWAQGRTAVATAKSDGSELKFTSLKYGYYVVVSTQGTAISVDSTNPNATIVDKNSTGPDNLTKTVGDDNVYIGDTVTYTVGFHTSNYDGAGTEAKKIISYTISDTLPDFLTNVNVLSVLIDNDGDAETTDDQTTLDPVPQFSDKKIVLDWYDETNSKFLYDNGATVTITYTAVVTDKAKIDGDGNKNTVTLQWTTEGNDEPGPSKLTTDEIIYTYALALKKVDEKGAGLADAKFQFPFYVKADQDTDGAYLYAGTTAGEGLVNELTTPNTGLIIVKGVKADTEFSITEVDAPNGYNKLTTPVKVTPTKTGTTTTDTTIYLDADGNVLQEETTESIEVSVKIDELAATAVAVLNKTGSLLPSTGGIGTTIFYVAGSILLVGAVIFFVVRKRMNAEDLTTN